VAKVRPRVKARSRPRIKSTFKAQRPKSFNFSVFLEDYIPPGLIVRDKQVKQIRDTIDNFNKNGISSNLILQGVTGSGKTSTLQYVLKGYDPKLFTFVKCKQHKGIADVIAQIGNLKPLARQRAPEIVGKAIENLKKEHKIVILDDVTAVPSWTELLNYIDGIYREVQTPIFVTTNIFRFLDKLPDDVRHTLLFFRVDFASYNARELYEIVKQRVDLSAARISPSSLKLIAALSMENGSARDALTMTRTAIQLGKTGEKDIREMRRMLEEQTYMDYLNKLAPKERKALDFITEEYVRRKEPIPVREISRALGLSPSRTSQLITSLEQYEIITAKWIHGGAMGNYRVVEPERGLVNRANLDVKGNEPHKSE